MGCKTFSFVVVEVDVLHPLNLRKLFYFQSTADQIKCLFTPLKLFSDNIEKEITVLALIENWTFFKLSLSRK